MSAQLTAAERVKRSRWAGQVETAANKLHQLLLEAPIPMPREPVIDMGLVEGLIELTRYQTKELEPPQAQSIAFRTKEKNQRDWMREIALELNFDRESCIQRYAELDECGTAPRKRKSMSSYDYAAALWRDGVMKGWLSDGNSSRQGNLKNDLGRVLPRRESHSGDSELVEIAKVEKRLKLWVNRQHQVNAKILNAFLKLEQSQDNVRLGDLATSLEDNIDFSSNFDQMRSIAEKNHGKIFDLTGDLVTIWPRVESAVRLYQTTIFGEV